MKSVDGIESALAGGILDERAALVSAILVADDVDLAEGAVRRENGANLVLVGRFGRHANEELVLLLRLSFRRSYLKRVLALSPQSGNSRAASTSSSFIIWE